MDPAGSAFLGLALAAGLVLAFPGPGRRRLDAVVRRSGAPVGDAARELVRAYLRRTRRGRAAGVLLVAVWLSFLLYAWFAVDEVADTIAGPFAPFALAQLLLGYLAGSALSEVTWRTAASGSRRAAGLHLRTLSTYLPRWVPALQRGFAALAVVLLGVLVLLVQLRSLTTDALVRSPAWGAVLAVAVVVTAVGAELGQRRVLARPQSWPDEDVVRMDDMIRGRSQRNLAVASLGIQLLLLTQLAMQVLLRLGDVAGHDDLAFGIGATPQLVVPLAFVALVWQRLYLLPPPAGRARAADGATSDAERGASA